MTLELLPVFSSHFLCGQVLEAHGLKPITLKPKEVTFKSNYNTEMMYKYFGGSEIVPLLIIIMRVSLETRTHPLEGLPVPHRALL